MSHNIKASPTKNFFINMITRDIELKMAILDLVDNSVDSGYLKADSENLEDIEIKLIFTKDSFSIEDNCKGFDIETAEKYVFRFGSDNKTLDESTIGQFGIGMKRSIFKMGNSFNVESFTETTHLIVEDKISTWSEKQKTVQDSDGISYIEDDWSFSFKVAENIQQNQSTGTILTISELYEPIKKSIVDSSFMTQLTSEIEIAHMLSLNNNLKIMIQYFDEIENENKTIHLKAKKLELINNELIKPINLKFPIKINDSQSIDVHVYLGVTQRKVEESGFYIFCNKRTIVHANRDAIIWSKDRIGLNWHHNYALFRGYVFLEAKETSLLPWTTTKDGVDVDSIVFQKLIRKLKSITEPIFDFLKKAAKERDEYHKGKYLNTPIYTSIDQSVHTDYVNVDVSEQFKQIIVEASKNDEYEKSERIQYDRPVKQISKLQDYFGVNSNYEVGEKTFDFCYQKFIEGK